MHNNGGFAFFTIDFGGYHRSSPTFCAFFEKMHYSVYCMLELMYTDGRLGSLESGRRSCR